MSARLRLSHASGWATTCSPSKSLGGIAALCHGDDDRIAARGGEGKRRGAFRRLVCGRRDRERRGGFARCEGRCAPCGIVALRQRPRARIGAQVEQPAAACGFGILSPWGVTESILPPVSPVLSSLHDTDTESTSASSRKRNFFIAESRLKFVSGPAVRSGAAGQKRDGNLCVPSRERVAVIRPLPGSCPRT